MLHDDTCDGDSPDQQLLRLAHQRWSQATSGAPNNQRIRELEDIEFHDGNHWLAELRAARAGQVGGGGSPDIPARPCLTIPSTIPPVRVILNAEREADMGIEITPADDFAGLGIQGHDDAEIEVREGLTRRIQRTSEARDARTWAFARAVIAGTGVYAVSTRYASGQTFDQDIYVRKFYNQSSVVLDPAHEMSDGSDAEWGFIGVDMPIQQYRAEFPYAKDGQTVNPVSTASEEDFRAMGDEAPDWFAGEGDTRACRVVEYFYTVRTTRELALMPDGSTGWADELPEGAPTPLQTRSVIEKAIKWAKIDGYQVLDETDWPGPDMPFVKVVGEELQPYDKERRAQGIVRPMREPCFGLDVMVSKQMELIGLSPLPAWQYAEGQVEGYESWYDLSTTRAVGRLPYKQTDLEGRPAPPPFRVNVETPIQAVSASAMMFNEVIQSVSVHDPSLGKASPSLKSGKAIDSIINQDRHATGTFLDNLARSIRYEGQIINGLLYPIYGARPGRLARIIDGEGNPQTIAINQAPQLPQGQPGQPPAPKVYPLSKGFNANVVVKVSKDYDTRSEQQAEMLGQILSADPALMQVFGDLFFAAQKSMPGHQELADRMKLMLAPPVQSAIAAKAQGQEPLPPQVQAALQQTQQIQQENQQLKGIIQSKVAEVQAKGQIDLQKAQIDAQSALTLQQMKDATAIEVARINAAKAILDTHVAGQEEHLATGLRLAADAHSQATAQAHDAAMQAQEHNQAQALQAMNAEAARAQAEQAQPPEQAEGGQ